MTKAKVTELEAVLDDCEKFLELVPLMAIQRGMQWFPSEDAILLGIKAKDSLEKYRLNHHFRIS